MSLSVRTLQRRSRNLHERWQRLGPKARDDVREAEEIPREAVRASGSLDGVMVSWCAGEEGRPEASGRAAACGTVSAPEAGGTRRKPHSFGRMPEQGKATLKGPLASDAAHLRTRRPEREGAAVTEGAAGPRDVSEAACPGGRGAGFPACLRACAGGSQARPGRRLVRERSRDSASGSERRRQADSCRTLRAGSCKRPGPDGDRSRTGLFRKHRHRMRDRDLQDRGLPIGSGGGSRLPTKLGSPSG